MLLNKNSTPVPGSQGTFQRFKSQRCFDVLLPTLLLLVSALLKTIVNHVVSCVRACVRHLHFVYFSVIFWYGIIYVDTKCVLNFNSEVLIRNQTYCLFSGSHRRSNIRRFVLLTWYFVLKFHIGVSSNIY